MEYVYLLQEREFIKTGEPIYKIGMTKQEGLKRFKSYPKGSRLLIHICCEDSRTVEREIIKLFCEKFKRRLDIGFEYFEGDYLSMIKYVYEYAAESVVVPKSEPRPNEPKPVKYSRQTTTRDNLTIMKNLVKIIWVILTKTYLMLAMMSICIITFLLMKVMMSTSLI